MTHTHAPAPFPETYDVLVVGGGINGVGIARDAVGRGLSVLLCEQHDLAQHTSSASTKLIHGGLRYLEYYEFALVRKALQEREVLMKNAPHIMFPLRFVMPHDSNQRPAWMIRCGLFLYDHLAKREILPASRTVRLAEHAAGQALKGTYKYGFVYSDGWVDDARLVALNALDAHERGAQIHTRCRLLQARRLLADDFDGWLAKLEFENGEMREVRARSIVNAAGPWAAELAGRCSADGKARHGLRLIKGSHIIVPRLFTHEHAYIFQNPDKRIIFAIPYQQDFTLIGTTDLEYRGDPGQVAIDDDEISYLCEMANRYFRTSISAADVVHTYSGVRPLLDNNAENASAITRDYLLELDTAQGAPMLNVWGGKITTYRKLAEEALSLLLPALGLQEKQKPGWTHSAPLPGGDLQQAGKLVTEHDFPAFLQRFQSEYPFLPAALAQRLAHNYGSRARRVLQNARSLSDLGTEILPGLYAAEVEYLCQTEWARSAQDIVWRRSKLGLRYQPQQIALLQTWLEQRAHGRQV